MLRARKRFGQHFLQDPSVIHHILTAMVLQPDDIVIEIGPGRGALTFPLLAELGKLIAIELDRDLIPLLMAEGKRIGALTIHQGDALRLNFRTLSASSALRIVGNLPYNISTPLLFHLLTQADVIRDMTFMLQKEVVDRITAKPGESTYGRLSVMIQYHCAVDALFTVPPEAFMPPPQVDSAVVRLIPHQRLPYLCRDLTLLSRVVQHAFNQRRKTLRNSLSHCFTAEQLEALNIDPQWRAQQLSVEMYVRLANALA